MVSFLLRRDARDEKAPKKTESRNVLVAVAGNKMDDDLVRMACTLAKHGKGHVIAINVIEVPRRLPLDAVMEDNRAEQILDNAVTVAQELNVEIEAEVVQAREAGPAIVDEANDRQCRLILLGIDPRTRFGQFDLGKTVPYVLEHAKGRVWVVRDELAAPPQG
jgi:nucleotide-binding universal stress UspA family protein